MPPPIVRATYEEGNQALTQALTLTYINHNTVILTNAEPKETLPAYRDDPVHLALWRPIGDCGWNTPLYVSKPRVSATYEEGKVLAQAFTLTYMSLIFLHV